MRGPGRRHQPERILAAQRGGNDETVHPRPTQRRHRFRDGAGDLHRVSLVERPEMDTQQLATPQRGNGGSSRTFTYGYEPNSPLLKSLAIADGNHPFTLTREYEAHRDLVTSIEAKWGSNPGNSRTRHAYVYNSLRQRESVEQSGDVFADYGDAIHQIFTYNARGELSAAGTFLGAVTSGQSAPLSARKHEFDYDGIGNRKWSNTSGNATLRDNYSVNELNQYTQRENNTLAVGGTVADANIKVAAGDTAVALAGRRGRHWGDSITAENWVAPFHGTLRIHAVNPTTNTRTQLDRIAFLPPAVQAMTYDPDGNLTNDGVWVYTWDAENRLGALETTANAVAGGMAPQRIEFAYDHLHRRVEKKVRGGWNGNTFTSVTAQRRYLYDGWEPDRRVRLRRDDFNFDYGADIYLGPRHRQEPDRRWRRGRAPADQRSLLGQNLPA